MTLAPISPTSEVAVTTYLENARSWLDKAVTESTPLGIGQAKVELAIAAEATKHLNLSKEIQDDAQEMVRRAEFVLRKSVIKAQENGEVATREANLRPGNRSGSTSTPTSGLPSAREFFSGEGEYRDANAMGALDDEQFEDALAEAKVEGNLSRANVARKAREKAGKTLRGTPRPAAEKTLGLIEHHARKAAREAQTLTPDQIRRVKAEAGHIVTNLRQALEVLEHLVNSLDTKESK